MDRLFDVLKGFIWQNIRNPIALGTATGAVDEARREFEELKAEVSRLRVAIARLEKK